MTDSTTYFDTVAPRWEQLRREMFSDALAERILDAAGARPGMTAVDVGAGSGFLTRGLLDRGARVIAVDRSGTMLAELEDRFGSPPGLETRRGAAEDLPLGDGEADVVVANMLLHHVEEPALAIREMARTLAPGGILVIGDLDAHDHEFLRTEQHDRWLGFERDDVLAWLEGAGLEGSTVRSAGETCCSRSSCGAETAAIGVFLGVGVKPGSRRGESVPEALRNAVRSRYAEAARRASGGAKAGCGCGCSDSSEAVVSRGLYDGETTEVPPPALEASLGCANPVALAELREGETVLDLGSGGGIDVILSGRRVGPEGSVYGLDMTEEMIELARRNVAEAGLENVEILRGEIEKIPLPDGSVDVVLSNCVINLSPEKPRVLAEAHRVLRPGGRFAVADIVATGPVPDSLRRHIGLWSACASGAMTVDEYRESLRRAGFEAIDLEIVRTFDPDDFGEEADRVLDAAGATAGEVRGLFASALVRARKPER